MIVLIPVLCVLVLGAFVVAVPLAIFGCLLIVRTIEELFE